MKKITLLLLLFLPVSVSFAETTAEVGGLYKFTSPMLLKLCDENGDAIADTKNYSIAANWQFTVEKIVTTGVIISFAKWNEPAQTGKKMSAQSLNQKFYGDNNNRKYFLISLSDFQKNCVRLQKAGTVSLVTGSTFIKLRPGKQTPLTRNGQEYFVNTDIGNDFTISALASVKLSRAGSGSNFFGLVGANFSSIKITPKTTQDFITSETNIGSIAPTIGIVYEINKVQIGVLSGIDILTGDVNRYWVYRGRPWIGIGIGFSLIKSYGQSGDSANHVAGAN